MNAMKPQRILKGRERKKTNRFLIYFCALCDPNKWALNWTILSFINQGSYKISPIYIMYISADIIKVPICKTAKWVPMYYRPVFINYFSRNRLIHIFIHASQQFLVNIILYVFYHTWKIICFITKNILFVFCSEIMICVEHCCFFPISLLQRLMVWLAEL